ncbi:hypothetical protein BG842_14460 [Haladaptatus sp. W1]|uniref:DUF7344 domain-containing protein n=1 Tax=Haladaptatus sp. W1 TaxID=1897478 RepID=UPI000849C2CF|nr:hypothetical protein [Haladaptatus sp. W1]ODR83409.1 hypothetical protein BG842_14460 [Haladaptatus sp. W1]
MVNTDSRRRSALSVDDIMGITAEPYRRRILSYLSSIPEDRCPVVELVDVLQSKETGDDPSEKRVRQRLHHIHLPKLQDHGLIGYDEGENEVRYIGSPRLETFLDRMQSPDDDTADGDS